MVTVMDNYVLGILWAIGRYSEDTGERYFFLRHKDRYFLDVVRQELGVTANLHQVTHKGRPQYRLKISGFDVSSLESIGWQPPREGRRRYPKIAEHHDFIRAYIEVHGRIDTLTIRDRRRNRAQKQPRLRIYGNKAFLNELTEVLAAEVGIGVKKVQKATNLSETSGILYYTSRAELQSIIDYLYQPGTRLLNRDWYNNFQEVIRQFK